MCVRVHVIGERVVMELINHTYAMSHMKVDC